MSELVTFGHGTAGREALTGLLQGADVALLVDIRRFPGSRRHPDVTREALAGWLPEAGIDYRWEPRLGGRRRLPADAASPDTWWRVEAFRAYAAHLRSPEFADAMSELLAGLDRPDGRRTAVLCSESLWWRCHRRLVSDAATLLHGVTVHHLGHDGTLAPHRPAGGARVVSGSLVYDRSDGSDGSQGGAP